MKKIPAVAVLLLAITVLTALASQALFSSSASPTAAHFQGGTLQLDLTCADAPDEGISGLLEDGRFWIPGDHREARCTIRNTGSLPSRWRMGVSAEQRLDPVMADNIIFSWYRFDGSGWKLVKTCRATDMFIGGGQDSWLYDQVLSPGKTPELAPGNLQQLVLQIDFELSASRGLQGKEFTCRLVLQGAQANGEGWFTTDSAPVTVQGADG